MKELFQKDVPDYTITIVSLHLILRFIMNYFDSEAEIKLTTCIVPAILLILLFLLLLLPL